MKQLANAWISYHPNMLSTVIKSGVVTHLEYVNFAEDRSKIILYES